MNERKYADFLKFAKKYQYKFKRISNATKREHEPQDVQNEAWLLAAEWEINKTPIDFDNSQDVDKLFSFLYNKLVNHSERKIRNGIRLDHYSSNDGSENEVHPLMNKLSAPENSQPLEVLLATEANANHPPEPKTHESRAGAYLHLLRHHKNKMKSVANYLLISLSYCYYRFNEALAMARNQYVLPCSIEQYNEFFWPAPWRPFRITQNKQPLRRGGPWTQMELDLPKPD